MKINGSISVNGLRTHYTIHGKEENPPLVYSHGIPAGAFQLHPVNRRKKVLETLGDYFHIFWFSHPGFNGAEFPKKLMTMGDFARHMKKFVEKMGIKKPVIAGKSFGGGIAAQYAQMYPDDIKGLVLIDSGTYESRDTYMYGAAKIALRVLKKLNVKNNKD